MFINFEWFLIGRFKKSTLLFPNFSSLTGLGFNPDLCVQFSI